MNYLQLVRRATCAAEAAANWWVAALRRNGPAEHPELAEERLCRLGDELGVMIFSRLGWVDPVELRLSTGETPMRT